MTYMTYDFFFLASFKCDVQKDLSFVWVHMEHFCPPEYQNGGGLSFSHLTALPHRRGRCDKAPSAVPPACPVARPRRNTRLIILIATLSHAGGRAAIMIRLQADICLADAKLRLDYGY